MNPPMANPPMQRYGFIPLDGRVPRSARRGTSSEDRSAVLAMADARAACNPRRNHLRYRPDMPCKASVDSERVVLNRSRGGC